MKKILIIFILTCLGISSVSAAEKIHFTKLTEAVDFITGCLESNDYKALLESSIDQRDFKGEFESLKNFHKKPLTKYLKGFYKTSFTDLSKNKEFPDDKDKFDLGGPDSELEYTVICFIKIDGKWYLKRMCFLD